jgi:hypothetical protein
MRKQRAKTLELNEAFKLLYWMKENIDTLDGLSFAEVGKLAVAENVLERDEITKDQIERVAKEGGISWQSPQTHITPSQFESIAKELKARIECLESQVEYLTECVNSA